MSAGDYGYQIVNGRQIRVRPTSAQIEQDEDGFFRRQGNHYTRPFVNPDGTIAGDPDTEGSLGRITGVDLNGRPTTAYVQNADGSAVPAEPLVAEPYRYRIVWAKGCHWSNRQSIVRELEGLEDAISINLSGHGEGETAALGWEFVYNEDHLDPVLGDQFLSESYYRAFAEYGGRTTVPALIDLKAEGGPAVINHDYNWLSIYLETAFRPFHKKGAPELYPKELRREIDAENLWLFDNINNSVYRCWLGTSTEGFEQGYRTLYAALDVLERRLAKKRFLFGDYVTDSDIRLYVTLARLGIGYTGTRMGLTRHRLEDYPNLWGYARDLWQIPAFQNNTFFADFAAPGVNAAPAYQRSYNYRFLRQIDFDAIWGAPTDRASLSADPENKFLVETDAGTARTADGFAGYSQTPEEKAAWDKDAEIYESIRSIKSTAIAWKEGDVVKNPADLPAWVDVRAENAQAIAANIARIPERPDLTLTYGVQDAAERERIQQAIADKREQIRVGITDNLTTLLTAVRLEEFNAAYDAFYAALDTLEAELAGKRFLLGDFISTPDIELFVSLVRFDTQYARELGEIKHRIIDYPNLWAYLRDLYIIPSFYHTIDWSQLGAKVDRHTPGYLKNAFYDYIVPSLDLNAIWRTETDRAFLSEDPTHEFLLANNKRFDR